MTVKFHTYCGLAGDLQELVVGVNEDGLELSELYNRTGFFKLSNLRKAKRRVLKQFELKTGKKAIEK